MQYIESPFTDAFANMALEEAVFENLPRDEEWFMLWQNAGAIVVGRYQNTAEEISAGFVRENGIQVVRRLSGGGAMFQDLGNLNFTFVVKQAEARPLDFNLFTRPVVEALRHMGVKAEAGDRNDILIDGKKISGNAQYNKKGRTMHHGTLLFSSRLDTLSAALNVPPDKIESKGVKSVRSRVTNIAGHLPPGTTLAEFKAALLQRLFPPAGPKPYRLSEADLAAAERLRAEKYATFEWNWGRSPASQVRRRRRYPFGAVTADFRLEGGRVKGLRFTGDFFGNGDVAALEAALEGAPLEPDALANALAGAEVERVISGFSAEGLAGLLMGSEDEFVRAKDLRDAQKEAKRG